MLPRLEGDIKGCEVPSDCQWGGQTGMGLRKRVLKPWETGTE
jgi:hypothetical protein